MYAIVLLLDPAAQAAVIEMRAALRAAGVAAAGEDLDYIPHITVGVCRELDVPAFTGTLSAWAAATPRLPVEFPYLGQFLQPDPVVWLGPIVNAALLHHQRRFYNLLAGHATDLRAYYLPDHWVPHTTILSDVSLSHLGLALDILRQFTLPIHGTLDAVTVVDVPARQELLRLPLTA